METLSKDAQQLLQLSKPNKSAQTILEAIGYDVDTSFGEIM